MEKTKQRVKVGRLSKVERDYIEANCRRMSPQEMAAKLERSVEIVLRALSDLPVVEKQTEPAARSEIRLSLKQSAAWKQLVAELETDELLFFEEQYVALVEQFKDDVLATEENQIFKVIKLDIFKSRNAVKQKRLGREIERLEREQASLAKKQELSDLDTEYLKSLQTNLQSAYANQSGLSTEYVKLEEKHQKLMEALKATRQQRIDRIDSGKTSFLDIIKELMVQEKAEAEGRQAKLMEKAAEKEMIRLGTPVVFSDGIVDQPILSSNTVDMLDRGVVSLPESEGLKKRRETKKKASEASHGDNDSQP